jgi:diguanylate cyclase
MATAKSPPGPADKPANAPSPALLAKAALKRLADQKLEPTPDNYRQAYEAEAGLSPAAGSKAGADAPAGGASGSTSGGASGSISGAPSASPPAEVPSQADEGERWSTLISRILRGAERGGRQWTAARKKDSLQRVLESSKSSAQRLHQRLSQLVSSWDSDTLDNSLLEAEQPAQAATATPASQDGASATEPDKAGGPETASAPDREPSTVATGRSGHGAGHESGQAATPGISTAWSQLAIHAMDQLADTVKAALPWSQAVASSSPSGHAASQGFAIPSSTGQATPPTLTPSHEAAHSLQAALRSGQDTALHPEQHEAVRSQIAQACDQARRIIDHRHHLVTQLTELCQSLTDSLMDLSEDDSWAQGQCQLMRHQLDEGLHSRGVRHVQQVLADTRARQLTLKAEREAARQALKQLIHQMLQEIGELGSTTDRFHTSLGRYADTIGQADSLESLTGVVREMVAESRAVQSVVAQTQTRLNDEHARASALTERVKSLEDEIRKLSDEVSTDPLTQIANRRGMMRAFEQEQARIERHGSVLSIGLLDVDNFKKLNDTLGHQTGDEALKFLARRVGECLRPVDVVARYGGEEFVVMLPETGVDEAQQVLTRLQRTLSAEFFTHEDKKVFITFSAGVTLYRVSEAIEAALERADMALYEAKRTGKNRTCMG